MSGEPVGCVREVAALQAEASENEALLECSVLSMVQVRCYLGLPIPIKREGIKG